MQKFAIPDASDGWLNKSISKKWRDHKSFLKGKYYDEDKTEVENARSVPECVTPQDWHFLVKYWKSETGKRKAEIGQSSRRQLKIKHTTGSCSFAVVRDELEMTAEGESIGEVDFFESTHTSKDGTYRDEFAADIVKEARKLIEERSTSSADRLTIQREAMTDVRGKERPGRVRGMGLGPTPSQVFGSSASTSSRTSYPDVFKMQAKMREEIDGLKDMIASLISQQNQNSNNPVHGTGQRIPSTSSHARTSGQNISGNQSNAEPLQ